LNKGQQQQQPTYRQSLSGSGYPNYITPSEEIPVG